MERDKDQKNTGHTGNSNEVRPQDRNRQEQAEPLTNNPGRDEAADFVVTEKNEDDREFVGGKKEFVAPKNELGIESTSDLMEKEAEVGRKKAETSPRSSSFQPIGSCEPSLPAAPPDSVAQDEPTDQTAAENHDSDNQLKHGKVKKLSPEEVKEIERNLYGGDPHLTDRQKKALERKINVMESHPSEKPGSKTMEGNPSDEYPEANPDLPPPAMAKRSRGIAYFFRGYIQIQGRREFAAGDELIINNRTYELRPKQFNTKSLMAAGAVVFALVLFLIGSQFVSETGGGQGEVVGIVLDENGQPFLRGATISFSELDQSITSNSQGFFKSGPIPEGSHKVEYRIDGKVVKVDYATVVSNNVTMLSLSPDQQQLALVKSGKPQPKVAQSRGSSTPAIEKPAAKPSRRTETETKKSTPKTSPKKAKSDLPAKINLAANVEGARLELDGSVLGAGNLTYSKIRPGRHDYEISQDGYQPVTGTINLSAGETKTLVVELFPLSEGDKAKTFSKDDYYHSGLAALDEQDFQRAIADLTAAIERRPSHAEAYLARGQAYAAAQESTLAYDDYLRAAEILQIGNDINQSVTAYNKAIELNENSVAAHLGRANAYLAKGEEIAAFADYQAVVDIDNRNAQGYFGLGEVRFRQGRYKNAVKHFRHARSVDSDNPLLYQLLMLCYLAMDDVDKVKWSFEEFEKTATGQQMKRLRADPEYSAVLRIVDND